MINGTPDSNHLNARRVELAKLLPMLPNFSPYWKSQRAAGLRGVTDGDCVTVVALLVGDLVAAGKAAGYRVAFGMAQMASGRPGHHCWVETDDNLALEFIRGQAMVERTEQYYALVGATRVRSMTAGEFLQLLQDLRQEFGGGFLSEEVFKRAGVQV